jgi:hypothetical protein
MGAALFIVPEREIEGFDPFVNGKALARCRPAGARKWLGRAGGDHLARLAQEAEVRPLMEFFSLNPEEALSMIEDLGGDPPEGDLPPEQWFPASEGLETVRGLLAYLATHPDAADEVEALVEDLRQFEEVLGRLDAEGVSWHLSVDF